MYRARDGNDTVTMSQLRCAIVNPLPACACHDVADSTDPNSLVMVAADGKNRTNTAQSTDKIVQLVQLGHVINQITTQQHCIGSVLTNAVEYLIGDLDRSFPAKMNIADVHHTA